MSSSTRSRSRSRWPGGASGFLVGNAEIVAALTKLKSYLDYGTFQPVQIAAIVAMNEATDYPEHLRVIYQSRRDTLVDGLIASAGTVTAPRGSMFIWAPMPEPYREWAHWSSPSSSSRRPTSRRVPASVLATVATGTCASRSSRTNCARPRQSAIFEEALHETRLSRVGYQTSGRPAPAALDAHDFDAPRRLLGDIEAIARRLRS